MTARTQRRPQSNRRPARCSSNPTRAVRGHEEVVLLATDEEGTFILFSGELPGHEVIPLALLSDRDRGTLGESVARSLGLLNVAAQGANAAMQAAGLVRLSPETLASLKAGMHVVSKEGWNLGTLKLGGRYAHQIRWLPAGSAGAVSILASIGPAASLVGIQWQLAQLSRLAKKNLAVTSAVLRLIRGEQWAEVQGYHDAVLAEFSHAQAVGAVSPQIWNHAQAQASEATLRKHLAMFFDHVRGHVLALGGLRGAKARREWLVENSEAVLRDVDGLLAALGAWFVYQALRVGSLNESAASDPQARALQDKLVGDARAMHEQVLATCEPLLDSLHRSFRLMAICPGEMGFTISGRKRTPLEVAEAARSLADQIAQIRGCDAAADPVAVPTYGWVGGTDSYVEAEDRLRWVLEADEALIAVTFGSACFWRWATNGFVAFTDRRALFLEERAFLREGSVDREVWWADVASIECPPSKNPRSGPDLVIEGDQSIHVQFTSQVSVDDVEDLIDELYEVTALGTNLVGVESE